jgi:membrane protein YdbS with pleckstrin-like domain
MGKPSKADYQTAGGMSVPVVVFIVFLILKLTNVISWSWWWVTSPLWISTGVTIVLLIIMALVVVIGTHKYK